MCQIGPLIHHPQCRSRPVPQTIFSIWRKILFSGSNPNFYSVIAIKFCTCHDSCAVVAWAKFCSNKMDENRITAWWNSRYIWVTAGNSVKWTSGSVFCRCPSKIFANEWKHCIHKIFPLNTSRPRQHGRHFTDDTFKCIFLNENVGISIKISLKIVQKGPSNNIPALV